MRRKFHIKNIWLYEVQLCLSTAYKGVLIQPVIMNLKYILFICRKNGDDIGILKFCSSESPESTKIVTDLL